MTQRSKIRDLVVVVPGMLGSRLLHHGAPLWGDDAPTFLSWVRRHGDHLARLAIGPDDPEIDDLGDGITPDGLLERPLVCGRFLRTAGYAPLLQFLQKSLTLRLGENLHVFPYDWRRDLEVAARRLATKSDGWLHAWKARSGNPNAKIVLIGHAMGGLVARYYADVLQGWPSVRQIISIGAPFLGSVRALDLLYFGADFQGYGLGLHDITPIARTFTSVYQLLPHHPSIQTFGKEVVSPFEIRIPTFEQQKMERSRQFHRNLFDHHSRNRASGDYAQMRSAAIVGIAQPTIERARLLANGTLSVDADPHQIEADGDGVVPRLSAEGGFNGHSLYLPQTHALLVRDPLVHAHLRDLLAEQRPGAPPPDTPIPRITLRRTMTDPLRLEADSLGLNLARPFYKLGQQVEIRVQARSASGHPFGAGSCRITARIEQLSSVGKRMRPTLVRMNPESGRPGWFLGRLKATTPGTFLATVHATHRLLAPFRAGDLFEVDTARS